MNSKRVLSVLGALIILALVPLGNHAADGKAKKTTARATSFLFPGPLQGKITELQKKAGSNTESTDYKKYKLLDNALKNYRETLKLKYGMTEAEVKNKATYEISKKKKKPSYFDNKFENRTVKTSHTADFYDYVNESTSQFEAWVDFANADLGGGVFRNGFVQEEVMCCEMPELANAAAVFEKEKLHIRAPDKGVLEGSPTPWIFIKINRVMEISAYGSDLAEKTDALMKHDVALPAQGKPAATVVNILAMAAPHLSSQDHKVQTALDTVKDLFNTFVAGYTVVKENAGSKKVLIHTGAIGTGDFNNSRCVVYVLQRLAAGHVDVNLKFWGYKDVDNYNTIHDKIVKTYKDAPATEHTLEHLLEISSSELRQAPALLHTEENNLHYLHTKRHHNKK